MRAVEEESGGGEWWRRTVEVERGGDESGEGGESGKEGGKLRRLEELFQSSCNL